MKRVVKNQIFASCDPSEFVGRTAELERLLSYAAGESNSNGLVVLAAPNSGTSELLRQAYDRLFLDQTDVIPFYFEIKASDGNVRNTAVRFLREFLLQTVAFRRRDRNILDSSPEICEIAELAVPADGYWIDRLIETCHSESKLNDDRSFVKNCLSAPLRAAGKNARSFVMIDGLHVAAKLCGGETFIEDVNSIFSRSSIPFVFAGLRRFLFAKTNFDTLNVDKLSIADAGKLIESLSAKKGVTINDQTRDLIAVQLEGNVGAISNLFTSALEKDAALDSFEQVQKVYTNELFGGRIGRYLDAIFDGVTPDVETRISILRLLAENLQSGEGNIPLTYWKKHTGLEGEGLNTSLNDLNYNEIINIESGALKFDTTDTVIGDYVAGRARLEIDGESRALVVGEALAANVRRAPMLMARVYRQHSAIGLRSILQSFDGRQISPALIDYGKFQAELKGVGDDKILKSAKEDNDKIALPQIVYTADAAAFYPALAELTGAGRSAVALGFESEVNEIAVIAAEIDSKLEATLELAEFWCDRLEMAAVHCNFANYKLWLIAPEGFTPDALEALKSRNAHASSRKQAMLLAQILNANIAATEPANTDEYEITIPMGEDTEMIAAHTIEDIAKRHNFPAKAINQIKTALVEACINATEHSLSPDRKIYQKFVVDNEKIVITIANRGLRLVDKISVEVTPNEGRRGWGLKLMKGLMDDVRIEQSDDGTRITMTKFIKPA